MFKSLLDKLGKLMIKLQIQQIKLPIFSDSQIKRVHATFEGQVQGVGFRVEVGQLATRLGLTGWVRNLPNSNVEAEIQGEKEKIDFLLASLKEHKRININNISIKKIRIKDDDLAFDILI